MCGIAYQNAYYARCNHAGKSSGVYYWCHFCYNYLAPRLLVYRVRLGELRPGCGVLYIVHCRIVFYNVHCRLFSTMAYKGHAGKKKEQTTQTKTETTQIKKRRTEVKNKTEVNRKNAYGLSSRPRKTLCFVPVVEQSLWTKVQNNCSKCGVFLSNPTSQSSSKTIGVKEVKKGKKRSDRPNFRLRKSSRHWVRGASQRPRKPKCQYRLHETGGLRQSEEMPRQDLASES